MKSIRSTHGGALLTSIILTGVVAIIIAAALPRIIQEYRFTKYSSTWAQSLHASEAGVEMAMQAFYDDILDNGWADWTVVDGDTYSYSVASFSPTGHVSGSFIPQFFVTANTNTFTISATGTMSAVNAPAPIARKVQVIIEPDYFETFEHALLGKGNIRLAGNADYDSFDSSDPAKSTNGEYDLAKKQTNADVGSTSSSTGAIEVTIEALGNGTLDGNFQTTEGSTVDIKGSFTHNGVVSDDLDVDIPDTRVPIPTTITDVDIDSTMSISVTGSTVMGISEIDLGGSKTATITGSGTLLIYVADKLSVSGNSTLEIVPNPTNATLNVQIYADCDVFMNSPVNEGKLAQDFGIWGTTNCSQVSFTGSDDYYGTIYAPQADVDITGSGQVIGAILGNEISARGGGNFHYDEALATSAVPILVDYDVVSWMEL